MPTRAERIQAILARGTLPPIEENVGDTSLPPVGVPQPVRPPVSPRILPYKALPPQTLRPPLARLGYRDTSLSPQARRALRETERINKRLARRAMARGLNVPDEEHQGKFASFLEFIDNLNRPQSAVFNLVRGIGQGLPAEAVMQNLTQGFSFEERVTFGDLLQDIGMDHDSKLRKVLGFAGDVVLDPINLVPGYLITKPFRIAAKGARRVKTVNALFDAAGATPAMRTLKKAFSTSTGNVLVDNMRKMAINIERFEEVGLLKKVADLDKKYGPPLGKLYRRVPYLAERPEVLSTFDNAKKSIRRSSGHSITPEEYTLLKDATGEFRGILANITTLEKTFDVKTPTLSDRIQLSIARLQKKEAGVIARKQKRILARARKRAIATGKAMGIEMADLPFKVQDDLVEYIGRRLPDATPETAARMVPGVPGFQSVETGKLKLDVAGMKQRATQTVKGRVDDLLFDLDRELDAIAGNVKFVEMKLAPKVNFTDPVTGVRIRAGEMHSFAEHVVKAVERLREGKYASLQGKIIGTGKRGGKVEDAITRPLSIRQVKERLREAIEAYARGDVDEKMLQRWLGLWVGPGAVELRKLTPIIAKIKARRAFVDKLVNFQGGVKEAVDLFTDQVLHGVFDMDEFAKLADPTILKRSGMQSYFTDLQKRVNDVAWAVKGGMSVPRTLAQAGKTITRPDFTSLQELGDFVTEAVHGYVKGDFSIADLTDLFGVKGTPGRETLRRGLEKIAKSQTLFDRIRNQTSARLLNAEQKTLLKFGPRYQHFQDLLDRVPDYVPHIMSPETIEQITRTPTAMARKLFSEEHSSMLWRRFTEKGVRPLDLDEVQAILAKGHLASLGGKPLFQAESFIGRFRRLMKGEPQEIASFFSTDPRAILASRAQRASRAIGGETFTKAARSLGRLAKDAPENYVRSTHKGLSAYRFDPEIVSKLDEVYQTAFGSDDAVRGIVRQWDVLTNYWKVWTLGIFPAYHFRNVIGSAWNMHLGGMFSKDNFKESLGSMVEAGALQRRAQMSNVDMLKRMTWDVAGIGEVDGTEMIQLLHKYGVIDNGFYAVEAAGVFKGDPTANLGDLPFFRGFMGKNPLPTGEEIRRFGRRAIGREPTTGKPLPFFGQGGRESLVGLEGAPTRLGVLVGRAVENQMKVAFFLHQIKHEALDPLAAMQKTAKYLFDYKDITQAEQVIKKWIPFYTWTRKNIPLQLDALIYDPQKLARLPKLQEAFGMDESELPPEEDIPQWIREASPIPLRRNPNGTLEFFLMQNWIPGTDLEQLWGLRRIEKNLVSMTHPLPKVLLENQFGRSAYFDADLTGETEFLGKQMDRKTVNVLRTIRLLNELDAMDPFGTFHKTRDATTWSSRMMRLSTGLRSNIASPEKERLRRLTERRERLQMILGQAKARERKERQRKQEGVQNDNREPATAGRP